MLRNFTPIPVALSIILLTVELAQAQPSNLTLEPYEFTAGNGTIVNAELGSLEVPENRTNRESRRISLAFVRFPSTNPNPGAPIVYLAGGPGGSGIGTARGARFPLFMALREVSDVIAFDQRGTGQSTQLPPCESDDRFPLDEPLTRGSLIEFFRATAAKCVAAWKDAGIDLAGYSTWESAADLNDLRSALGAERISLWGISYGTHLGLATVKRYPQRIERAVFASVEGLDETVKLPSRTDAYFERLQDAIHVDPEVAASYPGLANLDLIGLMRSVHAQLEAEPLRLPVQTETGETAEIAVGKTDLQFFVNGMISDPENTIFLPILYASIAAGTPNDAGDIGQYIYDSIRRGINGSAIRAMPLAMDIASGISVERLKQVEDQAPTALLGDILNFPMPHLANELGLPRLGDDFRASFESDVPTLFLSGTLDGRTYPESAAEIAARFSNATHILIENAGHNLFMVSPDVQDVIVAFMRGEIVRPRRLFIDPPNLRP
jgi:pimeloyl-ACP methyl ester carboxylesterase